MILPGRAWLVGVGVLAVLGSTATLSQCRRAAVAERDAVAARADASLLRDQAARQAIDAAAMVTQAQAAERLAAAARDRFALELDAVRQRGRDALAASERSWQATLAAARNAAPAAYRCDAEQVPPAWFDILQPPR